MKTLLSEIAAFHSAVASELLLLCCPALQEVPPDVLAEFEHKLEEDLTSVAVTLTAVTGVIIFWRGVWSLLDCKQGHGKREGRGQGRENERGRGE